LQVQSSQARAVTVDSEVATNSRTLHTLNVTVNSKMFLSPNKQKAQQGSLTHKLVFERQGSLQHSAG